MDSYLDVSLPPMCVSVLQVLGNSLRRCIGPDSEAYTNSLLGTASEGGAVAYLLNTRNVWAGNDGAEVLPGRLLSGTARDLRGGSRPRKGRNRCLISSSDVKPGGGVRPNRPSETKTSRFLRY